MNDDGKRNGGEATSFDARLQAARLKQGMDPAKVAKNDRSLSAMGVGMRVGVELVAALIVGVAIGLGLDHWLHTTPIFLVVFVLLGGAAGLANVMRLMGRGQTPGAK